jgi:hypothetical protein
MIEDASGDLFAANVDGLVNPVNTVGVKGVREAVSRPPRRYRRACAAGEARIGEVLVVDRAPASRRWVLNVSASGTGARAAGSTTCASGSSISFDRLGRAR